MMSTDIQKPHVSLNVCKSREDKKDKGKKEESQVEIYDNEDIFQQRRTDPGSRPGRHNDLSAVHRSCFSAASVLGVLYLLILAGTFMRYTLATLDKQNLLTERDQLNVSLNQAQTRILNLTEERDQLQAEKEQLNISLNQAKNRVIQLNAGIDRMLRQFRGCEHYLQLWGSRVGM